MSYLGFGDKEQIIAMIEKEKNEKERVFSDYQLLKSNYEKLLNQNEEFKLNLENEKNGNKSNQAYKEYAEKKINDYLNQMLDVEKKYNKAKTESNAFQEDNIRLRNELDHFNIIMDEMLGRKKNEIESLTNTLKNVKNDNENLKREINQKDDKLNDINSKIRNLLQENESIKSDNDHLTKIIEDSNIVVKTAEEKSKSIDYIEKKYKNQINQLELDIEKLKLRIKMQNEQMSKLNEDYALNNAEKNDIYESNINEIKDNYEKHLNDKDEEINNIKGEFVSMKIERDKYYTEYNILKKEYDKFSKTYQELNEKNMRNSFEKEESNQKIQNYYENKINLLSEQISKLEKENSELKNFVQEYNQNEGMKEKMKENDLKLQNEIGKMKKRNEELEKENEDLKKKFKALELEYKELELNNDIRINAFESSLKNNDEIYTNIENNIKKLMKEQNDITNNIQDNYIKTVEEINN